MGLRNGVIALIGNLLTIFLSIWVAANVRPVRRPAMIAPMAVIGWLAFATVALIDEAGFLG